MTGNPKYNGSGPARRVTGASRPSAGGATGKPDVAGPAPALPFSERMSDPGYSGEVQRLGPDWRIVVSMDATRYVLQRRIDRVGRKFWIDPAGRCPSSPAAILAKFGAMVPGLAAALAALPDDPADARPDFRAARAAQLAVLSDHRRQQRKRRAEKVAAFFLASKAKRAASDKEGAKT